MVYDQIIEAAQIGNALSQAADDDAETLGERFGQALDRAGRENTSLVMMAMKLLENGSFEVMTQHDSMGKYRALAEAMGATVQHVGDSWIGDQIGSITFRLAPRQ
jgi:hypothetical protein